MKALVVYESLWGNTAAVARAIAEGMGSGVLALPTSEATDQMLTGVDLLVAGAPLMGFTLPTDSARKSIETDQKHQDNPPDLSHPTMRSWLETLSGRSGFATAFKTRFRRSPGSAAKRIQRALVAAGYQPAVQPERFVVLGTYGPLKDGEIDRAREWGATIVETANRSDGGEDRVAEDGVGAHR